MSYRYFVHGKHPFASERYTISLEDEKEVLTLIITRLVLCRLKSKNPLSEHHMARGMGAIAYRALSILLKDLVGCDRPLQIVVAVWRTFFKT